MGNGQNALYFDVGGGKVYPVADGEGKILRNGPDAAEVAFDGSPSASFPFVSEMHIIVRRGTPGLYLYAVYYHGPGMDAGSIGETRFVLKGRAGTRIFTHHVVDDQRQGAYPTAENVRKVQDATWLLADGSYYTNTMFTAWPGTAWESG